MVRGDRERRGSRMRLPRSERGARGGASLAKRGECPPAKMVDEMVDSILW